jgi:hypothetical protein
MTIKKIFEIKFAYITNDTVQTSIINHIYHYTTPHEMVICESDLSDRRLHNAPKGEILIFPINYFFKFLITEVLHNAKNVSGHLNFKLTRFYCIHNISRVVFR